MHWTDYPAGSHQNNWNSSIPSNGRQYIGSQKVVSPGFALALSLLRPNNLIWILPCLD